jgi:hypothetical protein
MVKVANVSLWHSRYVSMYRTEYIEKVLAEVVSGGTSRLLMFFQPSSILGNSRTRIHGQMKRRMSNFLVGIVAC